MKSQYHTQSSLLDNFLQNKSYSDPKIWKNVTIFGFNLTFVFNKIKTVNPVKENRHEQISALSSSANFFTT